MHRAALTLTEAVLLDTSPRLHGAAVQQPATRAIAAVDQARCNGCGSCLAVCAADAIALEAFAAVDGSKCIGCGACVVRCPEEAILLERVAARRCPP